MNVISKEQKKEGLVLRHCIHTLLSGNKLIIRIIHKIKYCKEIRKKGSKIKNEDVRMCILMPGLWRGDMAIHMLVLIMS